MRLLSLLVVTLLVSVSQARAQGAENSLRAGDSIVVKISGVPAEEVAAVNASYNVSDNGNINLPYIGDVHAAGLRPSTLQKNIEAAYRNAQIFTRPTIQVTQDMQNITQVIFVSGEVKTPNKITMSPGMTVSGAITAAGGPTDFASMKRVKLVRGGRALELDCRQADGQGSLMTVQPGDNIHVPQ